MTTASRNANFFLRRDGSPTPDLRVVLVQNICKYSSGLASKFKLSTFCCNSHFLIVISLICLRSWFFLPNSFFFFNSLNTVWWKAKNKTKLFYFDNATSKNNTFYSTTLQLLNNRLVQCYTIFTHPIFTILTTLPLSPSPHTRNQKKKKKKRKKERKREIKKLRKR